jgi:hypothetical protein
MSDTQLRLSGGILAAPGPLSNDKVFMFGERAALFAGRL